MRLLFVISTRGWGGVKTWVFRTALGLQERGHQVSIACRQGDPLVEQAGRAGIDVIALPFGASWSPLMITRFIRLLRARRIQLTVCNIGRDLSTAGAAARLLGIPVIHRVGMVHDFRDTFVRRLVHRLLVRGMLVPAVWMIAALKLKFVWLSETEILASRHGVRVQELPTDSEGLSRRDIIMTGRLHRDKGQAALIRAFAQLDQDLQLHFAGDGPAREELEELVRELGLSGRVHFHGFVQPVRPLLLQAAIGVLFSSHEAISNTIPEYLEAGLAVLSTELPGTLEWDPDRQTIDYLPAGDQEALRQALEKLLNDPETLSRKADAGRKLICERFSAEMEARHLEEIYQHWIGES